MLYVLVSACRGKDRSLPGQDHTIWCDINFGEEDLDWIVTNVSAGKGSGVVAVKQFLRGSRIMVDPILTRSDAEKHPGFEKLEPSNESNSQKFDLNCIAGSKTSLCLRIARVNHSCSPNAAYILDKKLKVGILFAERDIKAGEEITISYVSFKNFSQKLSAKKIRMKLKKKWNIDCPADCDCRNAAKWDQFVKARDMDQRYVKVCINTIN
jgi:hypothetical protein